MSYRYCDKKYCDKLNFAKKNSRIYGGEALFTPTHSESCKNCTITSISGRCWQTERMSQQFRTLGNRSKIARGSNSFFPKYQTGYTFWKTKWAEWQMRWKTHGHGERISTKISKSSIVLGKVKIPCCGSWPKVLQSKKTWGKSILFIII